MRDQLGNSGNNPKETEYRSDQDGRQGSNCSKVEVVMKTEMTELAGDSMWDEQVFEHRQN